MVRAITNKMFAVKSPPNHAGYTTYTQGKARVIPIDTSALDDTLIMEAVSQYMTPTPNYGIIFPEHGEMPTIGWGPPPERPKEKPVYYT